MNQVIMSVFNIKANVTPVSEAKNRLKKHFGDTAMDVCSLIQIQIPMYTGNLNPTWKYWDDVANSLKA